MKNFILNFSEVVQCSTTDFFEPVAGLYEIQSLKRSSSESRSGPVDSI